MTFSSGFGYTALCLTVPLLFAAFLTIVWIVREVFPSMDAKDQALVRAWLSSGFNHYQFPIGSAVGRAWKQHYRLFPESRKHTLFGGLLIAASLSLLVWPIWFVLVHP